MQHDLAASLRLRAREAAWFVVPVVVLLVAGFSRRWVAEDAYINFRVVDQLLAGNGPVYNVGERVEVATSTVWLYLLVPGELIPGLGVEWWSVLLGLACTAVGFVASAFAARSLWRDRPGAPQVLLPVGLVALACFPPMWDWATSGLDTGVSFAWIGLSVWVLASARDRMAADDAAIGWAGPVLIGLGPLVRPDLGVLAAGYLLLLVWIVRRGGGAWRRALGQALLLPVLYEVFRAGYYGTLVPNPVLAKDASGTYWEGGLHYLADFAVPYSLWVPALLLLVLCGGSVFERRADRELVVLVGGCELLALAYGLLVVRGGGDYMHARLLLPPVFALVAPMAALPLPRSRRGAIGALAATSMLVGWSLACAALLRPTLDESETATSYGFEDERLQAVVGSGSQHPIRIEDLRSERRWKGEAIAAHHEASPGDLVVVLGRWAVDGPDDIAFASVPPGLGRDGRTVVVESAMGAIPHASSIDIWFIDTLGITDPVVARSEAWTPRAGHRKVATAEMVLARILAPDAAVPVDVIEHDPEMLRIAREAYTCGELAELVAAVEDPMTPGRFLRNLVGAPARTALEVPRDAAVAHQRFC